MKIVGARLVQYRVPFRKLYVTARGAAATREGVIVDITTDAGVRGLGEAALLPDADSDIEAFAAAVEAATVAALGAEITAVAHRGAPSASGAPMAAVEIAAWDALARAGGMSLTRLLGMKPFPASVAVNALVSAQSPEAVREDCRDAVRAGYSTIKLKGGLARTQTEEVERIEAAREAIGPRVKLRIDANGAWNEAEAFEVLQAVEPLSIEYVEQPLAAGNLAAMRRLRSSVGIPIAADEDVTDEESARRVIEAEAADVLVLKPLQLGGVRPTLRAAAIARGAGRSFTVTTTIDTGVGMAAALHLAAILTGQGFRGRLDHAAGLSTLPLLEHSLVTPDLTVERGCMTRPPGAGLGVELDEAALARYTVRQWSIGDV